MSKLGKTVRVRLEGKLKGKKRIIKVVKSKRRKKIVEKQSNDRKTTVARTEIGSPYKAVSPQTPRLRVTDRR